MPDDRWLHDHTGDETTPRSGFEDELADRLGDAWAGRTEVAVGPEPAAARGRTMLWIGIAAALLLVAFVSIALSRSGRRHGTAVVPTSVVSGSSTTTLPGYTPTTLPNATSTTRDPNVPIAVPADAEQRAVFDFLTALSEQRWADAATAMRGSIEDTDRADLRPIFDDLPDVALGLRRWCADGGVCVQPSGLDSARTGWVSADYVVRGRKLMQWFHVSTFEGKTTVRGLPIKVPADIDVNQLVQCGVSDPASVVPADLNGDGWFEQVITDTAGKVTVCDTTLKVLGLTIKGLVPGTLGVYPVDVVGKGVDQFVIGFHRGDGFQGQLVALVNDHLETNVAVFTSALTNTTLGCETFNGPDRALAEVTWKFEGGSTQETATGVQFTYTPVWPTDQHGTVSRGPGISPTSADAVSTMNGVCGDRPIFTH